MNAPQTETNVEKIFKKCRETSKVLSPKIPMHVSRRLAANSQGIPPGQLKDIHLGEFTFFG